MVRSGSSSILMTSVFVLALGVAGCGGGGGGGSAPPAVAPPVVTPPAPVPSAQRWEVTLGAGTPCYRPGQTLALAVRVFDQNGTAMSNPAYAVEANVAGALDPDGSGGYRIDGEGARRVTVTYTGTRAANATIEPVAFDVVSDVTPPVLTVTSPVRAAALVGSGNVLLNGSAVDSVSPVTSVVLGSTELLDGAAPVLSQPINATVPAQWGLNVVELAATDRCGNRSERVQSFLQSGTYLTAASAPNPGARVSPALTARLGSAAIDDGDRNDRDDLATLVEDYLLGNVNDLTAAIFPSGTVLANSAPVCGGSLTGYTITSRGQVVVSDSSVESFALESGALRHQYTFDAVRVPISVRPRVMVPLLCTEPTLAAVSVTVTLDMSLTIRSTFAPRANGTLQVSSSVVSAQPSGVQASGTGDATVDSIATAVAASLASSYATAVANAVLGAISPEIEAVVADLTLVSMQTAGLNAITGVQSVAVTPTAFTQAFYAQVYPSAVGTPHAGPGSIVRTLVQPALPAGNWLALAINDNAINQGLWAFWNRGFLEISDALGFPGASLAISAMLPPVLAPASQPGSAKLGLGDLDITLDLNLGPDVIPPVAGPVKVEAYVSYVLEGTVEFDPIFRRFRLIGGSDESFIEFRSITDGNDAITDPEHLALIRDYATGLVEGTLHEIAAETLAASLLPASEFSTSATGIDLTLQIPGATRSVDHVTFLASVGAALPPPAAAYLKLNEPWTDQDLLDMGVFKFIRDKVVFDPTDSDYTNPAYPSRSTVTEYAADKTACEGDAHCLPDHEYPLKHGWYCGAGRPDGPNGMGSRFLDPVDFCCRVHDRNKFDGDGPLDAVSPANACGIVMCLSNAVGFPSTITDLMPSVERARQRMYDMSKLLCMGTSMPMDLPFPELVPP